MSSNQLQVSESLVQNAAECPHLHVAFLQGKFDSTQHFLQTPLNTACEQNADREGGTYPASHKGIAPGSSDRGREPGPCWGRQSRSLCHSCGSRLLSGCMVCHRGSQPEEEKRGKWHRNQCWGTVSIGTTVQRSDIPLIAQVTVRLQFEGDQNIRTHVSRDRGTSLCPCLRTS